MEEPAKQESQNEEDKDESSHEAKSAVSKPSTAGK